MNKENLNTLIALLESEKGAKRGIGFNMESYIVGSKVGYDNARHLDRFTNSNPCGTVACIAGHAAILARPKLSVNSLYWDFDVASIATDWLGLSDTDATTLFHAAESDTMMEDITVKQALKVLYHLRDTGNVDWSITN